MSIVQLTAADLTVAAGLVVLLATLSWPLRLGVTQSILFAALRTTVQLLMIGLVLKTLFAHAELIWVASLALFMLLVAGREVMARQKLRLAGGWGYAVGTASMFVSTFCITVFSLVAIVGVEPWYAPQYAIPLLGMMLGNTMNGIALGMDRLFTGAWERRNVIEAQLTLGASWQQAVESLRREAMRTGMIPMINAMAAAGVVSLPGMMTGQILSGTPPVEAVKYQILIMFMITAGTGFGTLAAVWLGSRRLFDERHRLRLERLEEHRS